MRLLYFLGLGFCEKIFKWDVDDLETIFCVNSRKDFEEKTFGKLKISGQEAKKVLKKGRKKWAIWPWEYADSFEGECIEEVCTQSEIVEFCSRQDKDVFSSEEQNAKLLQQRMQRYNYCEDHVEKRVNATKQINKRSSKKTEEKGTMKAWQKELSPERLFRGWWEELTKAYKRFCLQDETDCARKCNVKHGTCNLWEDQHEMDPSKVWKYRCECDPGYGPQEDTNEDRNAKQYLCAQQISQREREKCETLDYEDQKPITPAKLDEHLKLPTNRQKRMVGKYSNFANNYFLPAVVDIFYQTVPVDLSEKSCLADNTGSRKIKKRSYKHQCGGTLVALNDAKDGMLTDKVVTAAHCFCELGFKEKCGWAPDEKHFFIRIGLIDNTLALNPTWIVDYNGRTILPKDDDNYIDVKVKKIQLKDQQYIQNFCDNVEENGENDMAVMILERKVDLSTLSHVKPACDYKDFASDNKYFKGDQKWESNLDCYAGGWGQSEGSSTGLGLSARMKYAKVEILHPKECRKNIPSDNFLQKIVEQNMRDQQGEFPIICAGGFTDGVEMSNTAGGDSGGGLFCFDKENDQKYYYFMGALHGGNADARKDRYMYFSNNAYNPD